MIRIILFLFVFIIANLSHQLNAKIASVIGNPTNGEIFFEVNKDTKNYPASLTKLMTLYIVFDKIKAKKINLDDKIYFSRKATQQQPSKLGLQEGDFILLKDAINALIVKSANDVAVAVAEKISGNEDNFINLMNTYVNKMGLKNTHFANPHGLPNKSNLSTAYDIFILSSNLINNHQEFLNLFAQKKIKIKNQTYTTHNKLMLNHSEYIGLKTGYIRKSGFQISLLSKIDNQLLLGVYFGGNSAKERDNKIHFLMGKYSKKSEVKKDDNSKSTKGDYYVQTSSFKKISQSKKFITNLNNSTKILDNYEHDIIKKGMYFVTVIENLNKNSSMSLCDKLKTKKLDCIVKVN